MMSTVRCVPTMLLAVLALARIALAGGSISNGEYAVLVNDDGVLIGAPFQGLVTVDALPVTLAGRFAEWYGLSFDDASGHFEAVGSGNAIDWSGRAPVERVSFRSGSNAAVAVTRVGNLEIETSYTFDATGPYLIASVTFVNLGASYLTNFFYSREWFQRGQVGWSFPYDYVSGRQVPSEICRRLWMLDDIAPGESVGVGLSYQPDDPGTSHAVDVPLELWQNADWPTGLPIGSTNGISWGDYDGDGWIDMFACQSANLWRNIGGTTWVKAADLDSILPNASYRYGSSFGDYNNDGLADIGTEPRNSGGDSCFHLLENLGGG
ncbi:MAG: VCBS repeat-containing protein, partial [Planctomycetota bacterium]